MASYHLFPTINWSDTYHLQQVSHKIYTSAYRVCSWDSFLDDVTTIKITRKTRSRLADIGRKNETYDIIINRLIDFYKKNSVRR